MPKIDISTGFETAGQFPLNYKGYFKTIEEMQDLGTSDAFAYKYYETMLATCIETNKQYIWREAEVGETGILVSHFIYPNGIISNGIDYSNREFNFFILVSTNTLPTGFEALNEGNGIGWRLIGRDPDKFGDIGLGSIDGSTSTADSSTAGATGNYTAVFGGEYPLIGEQDRIEHRDSSDYSLLVGKGNQNSGNQSFIEGLRNVNSGNTSVIMGDSNTNTGTRGFLMGIGLLNSGSDSYLFGNAINNTGNRSFIVSYNTISYNLGERSILLGDGIINTASEAKLMGAGLSSASFGEIVLGRNNKTRTPISINSWNALDRILTVGNGLSHNPGDLSDALSIFKNGLATLPSVTNILISTEATGKAIVTREWVDSKAYSTISPTGFEKVGNGYRIIGEPTTNRYTIGNKSIDGMFYDASFIGLPDVPSAPFGVAAPYSAVFGTMNKFQSSSGEGFIAGGANQINDFAYGIALGGFNSILGGDGYGDVALGTYNTITATNGNSFLFAIGTNNIVKTQQGGGALGLALNVKSAGQVAVGQANVPWAGGETANNRPIFTVGIGSYFTPNGRWRANVPKDGFNVFKNGTIDMPSYGDGTITGTATYGAAFDSNGKLIEVALGGGGASISDAVYGAEWNGDTTNGASKNSIFNKIESIIAGVGTGATPVLKTSDGTETSWNVLNAITSGGKWFVNGVKLVEGIDYTKTGSTFTPTGYTPVVGHKWEYYPDIAVPTSGGGDFSEFMESTGTQLGGDLVVEIGNYNADVFKIKIDDADGVSIYGDGLALKVEVDNTYFYDDSHFESDVIFNGIINANSNQINGLANGTLSTDAVNKGQLDAAIAGASIPSPITTITQYTTASNLPTVTGTETDIYAYVTTDTRDKNGLYAIVGGSWKLIYAWDYVDMPIKRVAINWADTSSPDWITGSVINSTGAIVVSAGKSVSNFIPVRLGDKLLRNVGWGYWAMYDASRTLISTADECYAGTNGGLFSSKSISIIRDYVKYVRWSYDTSDVGVDGQIVKAYDHVSGAAPTGWSTAHSYERDNDRYDYGLDGVIWKKETNQLYDYKKGVYYEGKNSDGTTSTSTTSSGYIKIKGGLPYANSTGATAITFWDADKVFISGTSASWAVAPSTAVYINLAYGQTENFKDVRVVQSIKADDLYYLPFVAEDKVNPVSVCLIGDSIATEDDGLSTLSAYATLMREALRIETFHNVSVSGKAARDFQTNINTGRYNMPVTDVYLIALGTNDFAYNRGLGTVSDTAATDTFMGSLQDIIEGVTALNADAKVIFLTPIPRITQNTANAAGNKLVAYRDAIIKKAINSGHGYLDLFGLGINPFNSEILANFFIASDGTHPNNLGHTIYAYPEVVKFMQKELKR